jgi:chromosomal replication initiator protein
MQYGVRARAKKKEAVNMQDENENPALRAEMTFESQQHCEADMAVAEDGNGLENWIEISEAIRQKIGVNRHQFWIKPLYPIELSRNLIEIGCPTTLAKDYVARHYADAIASAARSVMGFDGQLKFTYAPRMPLAIAPEPAPAAADPSVLDRMAPGSIPPNPNYTFKDFVVGKTNNLAAAAAERAANVVVSGETPKFNPLFIHGQSGLGKTHLLHAIVWRVLQDHPRAKVMFITAETFMRKFIGAIKDNSILAFKDELRDVDLFLVDDLQFIVQGDKGATQEEFFLRFNELVGMGKQVVFSADRSPAHMDKLAERIRTRMLHGLTAEVHAPDLEMRMAIVDRKLERLQSQFPNVRVPDDVKRFIAHRISSNTRELEGALQQLVYFSDVSEEALTIELTRTILADRLNLSERRVTVEEIKRVVAGFYSIRLQDMDSPRRTRNLVRPRQTAMYLAKTMTPRSYPEIGRRFGDRDHTTVMHAVRQIERLKAADPVLAAEIEQLSRMIKEGGPSSNGRPDGNGGAPN